MLFLVSILTLISLHAEATHTECKGAPIETAHMTPEGIEAWLRGNPVAAASIEEFVATHKLRFGIFSRGAESI